MEPEKLYKKREGGKDVLNVKDMSVQSGFDEPTIRKWMKAGYLNPSHYTAVKNCVDGVQLDTADEERVGMHQRVLLEKTKGKYLERNLRDMAISTVVQEKRKESRPVFFKFKEKSAEEVFQEYLDSPAGFQRMRGKGAREVENIARGGQWFDNPSGQVAMPDDYDRVLWETTKQEAARLQVSATLGDKEAAEKYNRIRDGLADPELLPALKSKGEKLSVREKILRD